MGVEAADRFTSTNVYRGRTTKMVASTVFAVVLATLFVATYGQKIIFSGKDEENPALAKLDEIMKDIDLTKLKNMEAGPEKDAQLKDLKEKMVQLKEDLEKIKDAKVEDQIKNDAKNDEPAPVENEAKKDEEKSGCPGRFGCFGKDEENPALAKKDESAPVENEAKKDETAKNDVQTGVPLERDAKKDLKERVAGLLHKFHDAYKKMDQPKKNKVKGKLVKLFSDVKTLVAQRQAAAVEDQKMSMVAGVIHRFKDVFDHLDDEEKHEVAYKVRKLYSDVKRLRELKRDSHKQDTLKSLKAHLKDFIAEKIEETSSTAEEKDAKHAKITALMKRTAQNLKDNELPESKDELKDAFMDVVTEARGIIAPEHVEKKMDLTSMVGHAKEFIGKVIEKTSSTQEEKDAKNAKVKEIMHGVAESLKANDIPQTKDGLKESMKSIAHELIEVMKKK